MVIVIVIVMVIKCYTDCTRLDYTVFSFATIDYYWKADSNTALQTQSITKSRVKVIPGQSLSLAACS